MKLQIRNLTNFLFGGVLGFVSRVSGAVFKEMFSLRRLAKIT